MSKNIKVGDYVLASRWSDGKLDEPWAVGFIEEIAEAHGKPRYYVGHGNGELISMSPYRRAERITPFVGSELLRRNKEQDWEQLCPHRSIWGMKRIIKAEIKAIMKAEPSDTYEGLKRQFFALKRLLQSKEAEVEVYRKTIRKFNIERIAQLEAELASEREMNAILTSELYTQSDIKDDNR